MITNYLSVVAPDHEPRYFFFKRGGAMTALIRANTYAAECGGRAAVWRRDHDSLRDVPEIGEWECEQQ